MNQRDSDLPMPLVVAALVVLLLPAVIPLYFAVILEETSLRILLAGLAVVIAGFNSAILWALVRWINDLRRDGAEEDGAVDQGEAL